MKNSIWNWKLKVGGGYFKGNPSRGLVVQILDPLEDYPSGWLCFYILVISIYKFEFWISIDKSPRK